MSQRKGSNRNYKGSSYHLKEDLDVKNTIDKRLILMMVFVVAIASGLIARLYYIQIVDADHYQNLVYQKENNPIVTRTARGEFFDSTGKLVVKNKPINMITYMSEGSPSSYTKYELATNFATYYDLEYELVNRELKDLYLFLNNNGEDLVTLEELKELEYVQSAVDALKLQRVTDAHIATLTELEKEAFAVYLKMNTETYGSAAIILENASDSDISYLSENQVQFKGFGWGTTWEREYVGVKGLEGLIGSVSEIPAEKLDIFEAKGYARNDLIGIHGLEYQYESLLSGIKTQHQTDSITGELEEVVEGRKGYDLNLTIDMELQEKVQKIIFSKWNEIKDQPGRELRNGLDFVMTNPNTGEILAIVALREDSKGNVYNSPESIFLEAFPVGSVVKGATVYMGLEESVIKPGEIIVDRPLHIIGTQPRVSWQTLGPVTDLTALQRSSNIYMFMVAIRLGGGTYVENAPLNFSKPIAQTFSLMRNYFSQFGLGVETMVDYPREETGYKGSAQNGGLLLEFSIGQYDNYNAMQLNQYISTVANGGYRLQPYIVSEVRDSYTGDLVVKNTPNILNELSGKDSLARVQEGLRLCAANVDCGSLRLKTYTSAAKTGTAEYTDYASGTEMRNNAFVMYAPFEKPEIAISCIHSGAYEAKYNYSNQCRDISIEIADIYMNSN